MNTSKKEAKGLIVNSRELSAEELSQVGGAWGASDSGYYDYGYESYDSYYDYGYDAAGGDYYDVPMQDYSSDYNDMIQGAVDMNNQWLADNPIQIEIFTIGDFTLSYSGSLTEGFTTALGDCLVGASGTKLGNDFATAAGSTVLSSSQAGIIGCTLGVGEGIIRDVMP